MIRGPVQIVQPFKSKPKLYLAVQREFAFHTMNFISSTVLNLTQNIFVLLKEGLKIHHKLAVLVALKQSYC